MGQRQEFVLQLRIVQLQLANTVIERRGNQQSLRAEPSSGDRTSLGVGVVIEPMFGLAVLDNLALG